MLGPPDGYAHPRIADLIAQAVEDHPLTDLFHPDAALLHAGRPPSVWLNAGLDRTLLAACDAPGPLTIVRGEALAALGGLRAQAGTAQLYDLVWRALDAGLRVERLSEVLVAVPAGEAEASPRDRRAVLEARIATRREPLVVAPGRAAGALQLARVFDDPPPVTLVVPTLQGIAPNGRPHLSNLLDSVAATDWPMDRLHVLVGDDSDDPHGVLTAIRPFKVERIGTRRAAGEPFNYAAKMNRLWRRAGTEHLVLLNDDVEVTSPGWLKTLMTFAVEPDVGAVGARLLFPSGRLQHAGVVGGLFGLCAHAWLGQPADRPTYRDWALVQREWSAVTGAVMATRGSVLERVNGFDERFSLDFNDIDLCFRMRVLGLRVVYTPEAELVHHEKASRGDHLPKAEEQAVFLRRWRALLDDDPAYHPDMSRNSYELTPALPPEKAWFADLRAGADG